MKTLRGELVSPIHFAAMCEVRTDTVYRWIKRGWIDTVTVGGRYKIPVYEIERMVALHKPGTTGRPRKDPGLPGSRRKGWG